MDIPDGGNRASGQLHGADLGNGITVCTEPLPKVVRPINFAR
jgi:hypothetical protein